MTCEWLLESYKHAKRLPVKNFLVGDSILPVDDLPDTENIPVELEPQPDPIEEVEEVPQRMPNAGVLKLIQIRSSKSNFNRINFYYSRNSGKSTHFIATSFDSRSESIKITDDIGCSGS